MNLYLALTFVIQLISTSANAEVKIIKISENESQIILEGSVAHFAQKYAGKFGDNCSGLEEGLKCSFTTKYLEEASSNKNQLVFSGVDVDTKDAGFNLVAGLGNHFIGNSNLDFEAFVRCQKNSSGDFSKCLISDIEKGRINVTDIEEYYHSDRDYISSEMTRCCAKEPTSSQPFCRHLFPDEIDLFEEVLLPRHHLVGPDIEINCL